MGRRRRVVEAEPEPVEVPEALEWCVVEDWVPPNEPVSVFEARQELEYLDLHFMRLAWRRFLRAFHERTGRRAPRWHRPVWRGSPYPSLPGWSPTIADTQDVA